MTFSIDIYYLKRLQSNDYLHAMKIINKYYTYLKSVMGKITCQVISNQNQNHLIHE